MNAIISALDPSTEAGQTASAAGFYQPATDGNASPPPTETIFDLVRPAP